MHTVVLLGEHVSLGEFECTEADRVLRHGEEQEGSVTAVEAEDALSSVGLFGEASHAHIILAFVQLENSLEVLGGVRARDLDGTDDTAYSRLV